jgi:hypothetical protein
MPIFATLTEFCVKNHPIHFFYTAFTPFSHPTPKKKTKKKSLFYKKKIIFPITRSIMLPFYQFFHFANPIFDPPTESAIKNHPTPFFTPLSHLFHTLPRKKKPKKFIFFLHLFFFFFLFPVTRLIFILFHQFFHFTNPIFANFTEFCIKIDPTNLLHRRTRDLSAADQRRTARQAVKARLRAQRFARELHRLNGERERFRRKYGG